MAKRELKARAIEMRIQEMSYSQIKTELGVSKGTLSGWLQDYPLSKERINELRGWSERRIEKCRETKAIKKRARLESIRKQTVIDIGKLSKHELFIAGLFLYWGEGSKTKYTSTSVSNTDPAVLIFFITWLELLGVSRERLKVHLHLYTDMNIETELHYWSQTFKLPSTAFRKPYIKTSRRSGLTYPQKFTHGTCNVIYENRDVGEYIHVALESIRTQFAVAMCM
jgi:hypothetical protein